MKNVGSPIVTVVARRIQQLLLVQPSHGLQLQDMQQDGLTQLFSEWARCLQRSTDDSGDSYFRAIFSLSSPCFSMHLSNLCTVSNLPTDVYDIGMYLQNPQQGCAIESAILKFGSHLVSSVDLRPQSKRLGCSLKLSW